MLCPQCGINVGDSMQFCASCKAKAPVVAPPTPKPEAKVVQHTSAPEIEVTSKPPARESDEVLDDELQLNPSDSVAFAVFSAAALIVAALLILFAMFILIEEQQNLFRASLLSIVSTSALVLIVTWVMLLLQAAFSNKFLGIICFVMPPLAFIAVLKQPRAMALPAILNILALCTVLASSWYFNATQNEWPHEAYESMLPEDENKGVLKSYW